MSAAIWDWIDPPGARALREAGHFAEPTNKEAQQQVPGATLSHTRTFRQSGWEAHSSLRRNREGKV